jgi:large subunit ribosomal protein L2
MAIKRFKPTTPTLRTRAVVSSADLTVRAPLVKSLLTVKKNHAGRNNEGTITTRHRGGGLKNKYRIIDFKRKKEDIPATVQTIEYDPNRTCRIALVAYRDGERSYILAPLGLKVGDQVITSKSADIKPGNTKCLEDIPVGTLVHNIEMYPGAGGQIARSAGSYAQLMAKEGTHVLLRLTSGELKKIAKTCKATIGQVGNLEHEQRVLGKAGISRKLGIRPTVRGVAMNPIDHPHGGGEGRTSGGRHPVTPWGKPTRGYRTRKNKRTQKTIVTSRHKKG